MNMRKTLSMALMAAAMVMVAGTAVWAFEPPPPPDWSKVQGPELWGVSIVYCDSETDTNVGVMRIKRVQDCEVETEAEILDLGTTAHCVNDKDEYLYMQFQGVTLFDIPGSTGAPIITKIKNFKYQVEGTKTIVSFDNQIKFIQP